MNSSICVINWVSQKINETFAELVECDEFGIALRSRKAKNSCWYFPGYVNRKCWVIVKEIWYMHFLWTEVYQVHLCQILYREMEGLSEA